MPLFRKNELYKIKIKLIQSIHFLCLNKVFKEIISCKTFFFENNFIASYRFYSIWPDINSGPFEGYKSVFRVFIFYILSSDTKSGSYIR